jgi:hypothetical protein
VLETLLDIPEPRVFMDTTRVAGDLVRLIRRDTEKTPEVEVLDVSALLNSDL